MRASMCAGERARPPASIAATHCYPRSSPAKRLLPPQQPTLLLQQVQGERVEKAIGGKHNHRLVRGGSVARGRAVLRPQRQLQLVVFSPCYRLLALERSAVGRGLCRGQEGERVSTCSR